MANNENFKLEYFEKTSSTAEYKIFRKDIVYSTEEVAEIVDQYVEDDIFKITLLHEYEVTKQDFIEFLLNLNNCKIELYFCECEGKTEIKASF